MRPYPAPCEPFPTEVNASSECQFQPGERALLRGFVLTPPVMVESVRATFCGHAESDPVIFWRHTAPGYGKAPQRSAEHELAPVPDGYEPPPTPMGRNGDWFSRALEWLEAQRPSLVGVHGQEAVYAAREHLIRRIKSHARIEAALAAEPGTSAMSRPLSNVSAP